MYDAGTRAEGYLRAYAREFGTVEIDSTFYGAPAPERVRRWAAQVPDAFTFAVKTPREITHDHRLLAPRKLLDDFVMSVAELGAKLEAILVQLPPDFGPAEIDALETFVATLGPGPRWAVELRDPAWFDGDERKRVRDVLGRHGVALAVTEGPFVPFEAMLRELREPTAPHGYLRWLGEREAMTRFDAVTIDRSASIARWAAAIREAGPSFAHLCGYANNEYAGHAPATVRALYAALGVPHDEPSRIVQTSLFE
jgi:uncharacterized protein YecE (DUF72 family)